MCFSRSCWKILASKKKKGNVLVSGHLLFVAASVTLGYQARAVEVSVLPLRLPNAAVTVHNMDQLFLCRMWQKLINTLYILITKMP